jgi:hypothetical protein
MVEAARYRAQSRKRREKHTFAKRSTVLLIACCLTSHRHTCEGFRAPVLQVCAARGSRASVCALATDRLHAAPPAARRTVATAARLRASRQPCAPLRLPRAARRPLPGERAMGPGFGRRDTAWHRAHTGTKIERSARRVRRQEGRRQKGLGPWRKIARLVPRMPRTNAASAPKTLGVPASPNPQSALTAACVWQPKQPKNTGDEGSVGAGGRQGSGRQGSRCRHFLVLTLSRSPSHLSPLPPRQRGGSELRVFFFLASKLHQILLSPAISALRPQD